MPLKTLLKQYITFGKCLRLNNTVFSKMHVVILGLLSPNLMLQSHISLHSMCALAFKTDEY